MLSPLTVTAFGRQFDFHRWALPRHRPEPVQYLYVWPVLCAVDYDRPWSTPVLLAWIVFDGQRGYHLSTNQIQEVLDAYSEAQIVFHDAVSNLKALHACVSKLNTYARVEQNQIWDSHLLSRSLRLATEGSAGDYDPRDTWKWCLGLKPTNTGSADQVIGTYEPGFLKPYDGHAQPLHWPMYSRDLGHIAEENFQVAAKNVVLLNAVFFELWSRLQIAMSPVPHCFGRLPQDQLIDQVRKWGPQTHHIQLRAAIVLDRISEIGLTVDPEYAADLHEEFRYHALHLAEILRPYGHSAHAHDSDKTLHATLRRLERLREIGPLARKVNGEIDTSAEALGPWTSHRFVDTVLEHRQVRAVLSNFLGKLDAGKRWLHPQFDPLKVTGRTSAFGEISSQNLPKDGHVRACIIPSRGHVFLNADYRMIELVALAYANEVQFGHTSAMAAAIREGRDLHQLVAARLTGKPESAVNADERQAAKAVSFGTPGGMGPAALQRYALQAFGVQLDLDKVEQFRGQFFELFPEIKAFLKGDDGEFATGQAVAELFGLTQRSYGEATGQAFGLQSWREPDEPHPFLGYMALRTIASNSPTTTTERPYTPAEVAYFWKKIQGRIAAIPEAFQNDVQQRWPSLPLRQAVAAVAQYRPVMTLTGRLRGKATFTACRNTIFQGLAADGTKVALWLLWRAGFRITNFIHDEVLIEVPETSDLHDQADRIRELMIAGMQQVIPNLPICVEIAASRRWDVRAKAVFDSNGRLQIWTPTEADEPAPGESFYNPQGGYRPLPPSQNNFPSLRSLPMSRNRIVR